MEQELADKIIAKCPLLFHSLKNIEAPDGWFNIINDASTLIEQYLEEHAEEPIVALQIKSKFGGLRYYTNKINSYVEGVIHMAERHASHSCEECGMPGSGKHNIKGWHATLCVYHAAVHKL